MADADILPWLEPLLRTPLLWRETGSAGGIRAQCNLKGKDGHNVEYLNLVTACASVRHKIFHSGEYVIAAKALGMPLDIANAMIRAGDNSLPEAHEHFVTLSALVNFLVNGGNILKD